MLLILRPSSFCDISGWVYCKCRRYRNTGSIREVPPTSGRGSPGCHTWRATGITIYLENDGRLEHAQQMAGHESPRTAKLYDRTKEEITLSEVERIRL